MAKGLQFLGGIGRKRPGMKMLFFRTFFLLIICLSFFLPILPQILKALDGARDYWEKTFRWIPTSADPDDAEYLYFIDLADKISDVFKKANMRSLGRLKRAKNKEGRGLSSKDANKLNDKIATLVRDIRLDLSREYLNENHEPEAAYALLRGNVRRLVMAYTDLWLFLTETNGAKEEFAKQMSKVQRKVARLKQTR